jgi:hypothetical protein
VHRALAAPEAGAAELGLERGADVEAPARILGPAQDEGAAEPGAVASEAFGRPVGRTVLTATYDGAERGPDD